jgi:hypothetical protein
VWEPNPKILREPVSALKRSIRRHTDHYFEGDGGDALSTPGHPDALAGAGAAASIIGDVTCGGLILGGSGLARRTESAASGE